MAFRRSLAVALTVFATVAHVFPSLARAQGARAEGPTPPRLSFVDGDVSFWRPGAEDWSPAQVNTPLAAGDSVYAGDGGNLEVEIGARAYVRAGSGTELGIDSLETGYLQLRVPSGRAALDLGRLPEGQEIEVDTPNGAFLVDGAGYYRFDVDDQATRFSVGRNGRARVVPAGGQSTDAVSGRVLVVSGTDTATITDGGEATADDWDHWNTDRTAKLGGEAAPRSARYVPPDVAGVDDLDRYGEWRDTPKYGSVWVPRDPGPDWVPYSTGRWVWDGYYGWSWVDDAPWGWAPYHYGRWCWVDGYWGWAPGPVAVRPVYSPALVAFFDGGGVSVSVGAPFVSWVALGWGEPVLPWWGPAGFVGRPYWGGWGGPRVVNNTVINNTTIVNVNNINRYDNFRNQHAVVGVAADRFGHGRVEHVRVDAARFHDLRPVHGELAVRPVRESLTPREGRAERPPDRIQSRGVVATRRPQDPARLPHAAGVISGETHRPESRLVTPPNGMHHERGATENGDHNEPPPHERRPEVPRGNHETRAPHEPPSSAPGGERHERGAPEHERNPPEHAAPPHGHEATDRLRQPEGNTPPAPPHHERSHEPNRDQSEIRVPGADETHTAPHGNHETHGRAPAGFEQPERAPSRAVEPSHERDTNGNGRQQQLEQSQHAPQPESRRPQNEGEAPRHEDRHQPRGDGAPQRETGSPHGAPPPPPHGAPPHEEHDKKHEQDRDH